MALQAGQGEAARVLAAFAARTGVQGEAPARRYLWTDAFAVCTWLGLAAAGDPTATALATALVAQVHRVLGRHRPDDARSGWISGLDEAEGARHPTAGGLRIGKPLPERGPDEPYDARREWDRDGQYFHYLTRWMHALDRFAQCTGTASARQWANELADVATRAFLVASPGAAPRMAWKMSIDLTRALVPSMGQHDPLDGWVTCLQLRAHLPADADGAPLDAAIARMAAVARGRDYGTDDPLGLGGLLGDALRLHHAATGHDPTVAALLALAADGIAAWLRTRPLHAPATQRLAFRELGLAIGLRGVPQCHARHPAVANATARLEPQLALADAIVEFWSDPRHQAAPAWRDHEDINAVMLATSLAPAGYLGG